MRASQLLRPLLFLLVPALSLGAQAGRPVTKQLVPDTTAGPKTVAVLYFDNHTGQADYDALGRGISAMLITDLSAVPDVRLVERDRLQSVIDEQNLQQSSFFDPATAVKTGKLLGAQYLLTGAFSAVDPQMRIDTRVIRVETGEIVRTAKVQGNRDDFFKLQQRLSKELIDGLPVAVSPEAQAKLEQQQQRNRLDDARTLVDLSLGLTLLDHRDYAGAIERLAPALARSHDALTVQYAYDEAKRRSAQDAKAKAKEKLRAGLRGIFNKRP